MKKILSFILAIFFVTLLVSCNNPLPKQMPEDFSFSLQWGIWGKSYYNSETGELIKSRHEKNEEDFKTVCFLNEEELEEVYFILHKLNLSKYDDLVIQEFDFCAPGMRFVIEVNSKDNHYKIELPEGICRFNPHKSSRARKIQNAIDQITEIIYQKEEWKALPKEEYLYI